MKNLNFGCGDNLRKGFDNADIQEGADIVFDFNKFPYPIKSNTYDFIEVDNVLEHLLFPKLVLMELHRICKKGGTISIIVPHYSNKGAYNDLEHLHYFNEMAFKHFAEETTSINKKKRFELLYSILTPTKVGYYIPEYVREKLSLFVSGLICQVKAGLKVIK